MEEKKDSSVFDKYAYDKEYIKKYYWRINLTVPKWQKALFDKDGPLTEKLKVLGKSKNEWFTEILSIEAAKVLGVNQIEDLLLDEEIRDKVLKECGTDSLEKALPPKEKERILAHLEKKKRGG